MKKKDWIEHIGIGTDGVTVLAAAAGLVVLYRNVPYLPPEERNGWSVKDVVRVFWSIWPIVLTILLIFVFKLNMLLALAISSALSLIFTTLSFQERWKAVLKSLSPKIILLTASLMVFKRILEVSGALDSVVRVFPARRDRLSPPFRRAFFS